MQFERKWYVEWSNNNNQSTKTELSCENESFLNQGKNQLDFYYIATTTTAIKKKTMKDKEMMNKNFSECEWNERNQAKKCDKYVFSLSLHPSWIFNSRYCLILFIFSSRRIFFCLSSCFVKFLHFGLLQQEHLLYHTLRRTIFIGIVLNCDPKYLNFA